MENYFEVIRITLMLFPIIALIILVPYIAVQYKLHGYVQLNRALIFYVFLFYIVTAFFMTILPLPELTDNFCAVRAGKLDPNFTPFRFLSDMAKELENTFSFNAIIRSNTFMVTIFNMIMLAPLGFFLNYLFGIRNILIVIGIGFLTSLFFEVTQLTGVYGLYPCAFRLFEVDDLMTNTFGAYLGFVVAGHVHFLPNISEKPLKYKAKISFSQRFLALFLDLVILTLLSNFVFHYFIQDETLLSIVNLICYFLYFVVLQKKLNAQTLGKKVLGLRIISTKHKDLTTLDLFKRYLILILLPCVISILSNLLISTTNNNGIYAMSYFLIMFIWFCGEFLIPLFFKKQIPWHDKWAKTSQVKIEQKL